jgi:hypothetical protein
VIAIRPTGIVQRFPFQAAGAPKPTPRPSTVAWANKAGGHEVRWSKDDILVRSGDDKPFSAKAYMAKQLNVADYPGGTYLEASARVKSVVGGIMSLQYSCYYDVPGAAHPGGETRFAAINVAKPEQPVKLTDMFPESDVLKALLADPQVKGLLKQHGMKQPPKSLEALFQTLEFATIGTKNHAYTFSQDVLSQFAIHHVEGNQAFVRLGMPSASGADRYAFGQLGLKLPIPAALRPAFAQAQKAGTVAQALDRVPASKDFKVTYMDGQP